ncbi:MAG TPA: response regulator, partial [Beijerinckiaceae bacterium]
QADGSATRRHQGSGLGLAIARRIAERMEGTLTLESTGATGSVFVLDLPLRPADRQPEEQGAAPLAGRRGMIVGRSPFESPSLGERLAGAGAQVRRLTEPEAAIRALRDEPPAPDIVIVDCALGRAATEAVAAAARAAGVARSLVLFSPFERRAIGQATLGDFDGWLVKPVRSGSLLARLGAGAAPGVGGDAPSGPPPATAGLEVLLAEDNEINALVARRHLEAAGARVARACDGAEAVALALAAIDGQRPRFDAILMDVRMPGLDGLDATRRIRGLEQARDVAPVRIVALTANAFDEDRRACFEAGVDDFLVKPFDAARLARAVAGEAARPA